MTLFGLSPLVLAALVAGTTAALFVLHRLRVRPEVKRVPTLLFWREAVEETRARTLFGRFRHPRTFAFLCVLAALLAAALADPMTDGARAATRHIVVVVDDSVTTSARPEGAEGERTVWNAIRENVLTILDEAGLGDRIAVVTTSMNGGLVAGFDTPRPVARLFVEELFPKDAPGDHGRALERAAALLTGRSRPSIVFLAGPEDGGRMSADLTDGQSTVGTNDVPLQWVCHQADRSDQGLIGARFRDALEVLVAHRGGPATRELEVQRSELGLNAETILRMPVTCATESGARWVEVPGVAADGSQLTLWMADAGSYPGNDVLMVQLPDRRTRQVFLDPGVPRAVRLLVEAHPRLRRTEDRGGADLVIRPGETESQALPAGVRPRRAPLGPFADGAGRAHLPRLAAAVHPLAPDDTSGRVLLTADGGALVQFLARKSGWMTIAPELFESAAGFVDDPAGAAALAETIEWAAGNRPGSVAVPGARCGVLAAPAGSIAPNSGRSSDLVAVADGVVPVDGLGPVAIFRPEEGGQVLAVHSSGLVPVHAVPVKTPMPELPSAPLRLWEWLALAALGLLLVDAWLHTRGRIP